MKNLKKLIKFTPFFYLLLLTSCQKQKDDINFELIKPGHYQLYSQPEWQTPSIPENHIKRVVLVGTNDFHGRVNPEKEYAPMRDGSKKEFFVGGVEILSRYFQIMRERYPNQTIFLDAGDMFQGTLISNHFEGEPVVKAFNYLKYDALTLGNHEFDFGPKKRGKNIADHGEDPQGSLKKMIRLSSIPMISSNVIDIKTGRPIKWSGVKPYLLKTVNDVKIGVIGLSTLETPQKTIPENVTGLFFQNMTDAVIKYSKILRKKGAELIFVTAHSGGKCGKKFAKKNKVSIKKVNFQPYNEKICNKKGEIFQLAKELPKGMIDAIVSGHTHTKINNFINGVPIIQSYNNGKFFGRIEFFYDKKNKKLLKEKTNILPPIKLCHHFFKNTQDCYGRDEIMDYSQMVPAKFLGKDIFPDQNLNKILSPYRKKIAKVKDEYIVTVGKTLRKSRKEETDLGKLAVHVLREFGKTDFALLNSGAIREDLDQGIIRFEDIYRVFPYSDKVSIVTLTGEQVRNLARISTSGHTSGLGFLSGLKVYVDQNKDKEIKTDQNNDGKKELWERDRITKITLTNGEPLDPKKEYTLTTSSFLAFQGGDHYGHVFDLIPEKNKLKIKDKDYRSIIINFLKTKAPKGTTFNPPEKPFFASETFSNIIFTDNE